MPLPWSNAQGPSSPVALPWDHLLPCSSVRGGSEPRSSPAASLAGSSFYSGPHDMTICLESQGQIQISPMQADHTGAVPANRMNKQDQEHGSAGLTAPPCCAVRVCKEPAASRWGTAYDAWQGCV